MQAPVFPSHLPRVCLTFNAQIWQLLLHPLVSYQARPAHCHVNYHKQSPSLLPDSENSHESCFVWGFTNSTV